MGFTAQSGFVGFKTQTAKGTYLNPGAVSPNNGVYVRTRTGNLGVARDLLIPDAEIGGNRDVSTAELGPTSFQGQYSFYPRMDSLPTLLAGALGVSVDSSAGTGTTLVGTHTINTTDQIPWISIEEQIGNGLEVYNYTDSKINSFGLSVVAKGYLEGTVDLVAIKQTAGNTATVLANRVFDTSPQLVGTNVSVTFGGVTLPLKEFKFDIKNNLETDDERLGSLFLGDITEKRREITCTAKIRPSSNAILRQAAYGTSAATQPGGSPTPGAVVITMSTWEVIGTTATPYSLTITAPVAILKPHKVSPSNDSVIEEDFDIQFFRPVPATDILTAVIINHLAVTV